jgi:quercetin 2,3-dioxygenase
MTLYLRNKSVIQISDPPARHWVGNGFHVHGLFGYDQGAQARSPFLLLDYGAPRQFEPNAGAPRGVGEHPHRGFETVTIVYEGEVEHRDSAGGGGVIGPGDVQWMTAGAGIVHQEFHSQRFSEVGGPFHMVQLWVNLPASKKFMPAGYQGITNADIPRVSVAGGAQVRVIAGRYAEAVGPAVTQTPMQVWDLTLPDQQEITLPVPESWTCLLVVLSGQVQVGAASVRAAQYATLNPLGQEFTLRAEHSAHVLLLAGEPIHEPIVGHGPFVMNSRQEIIQAMEDYQRGRFGRVN